MCFRFFGFLLQFSCHTAPLARSFSENFNHIKTFFFSPDLCQSLLLYIGLSVNLRAAVGSLFSFFFYLTQSLMWFSVVTKDGVIMMFMRLPAVRFVIHLFIAVIIIIIIIIIIISFLPLHDRRGGCHHHNHHRYRRDLHRIHHLVSCAAPLATPLEPSGGKRRESDKMTHHEESEGRIINYLSSSQPPFSWPYWQHLSSCAQVNSS